MIGTSYKLGSVNLYNKFTLTGDSLEYTDNYNYLGLLLDKNMTLLARLKKSSDG